MPEKIRPPTHSSFRRESEADLPDVARAPDIGPRFADETFSPEQAAEFRAMQHEPNRLGRPYTPSGAELILQRYTKALADYRADYAETRSERLQRQFLEAKQAMIDAGLMKGDV